MPNILDIRRRIRSVINTRQITKAMKMVAAARLRRAQERALSARPYAQMLTNVLQSLVARAEIYDPETGEPRHPLLARREEKNVFLAVVTGDKGLAGAFNTNILKAATHFLESKRGKNVSIVAVGRKGRDFLRRRYPAGSPDVVEPGIHLVGEQIGILGHLEFQTASEMAERLIARYTEGGFDSVYFLFNEFKSVIAQRLVVEKVLPIRQIGVREAEEELTVPKEELEARAQAAASAGVSVDEADTHDIDAQAATFGAAAVDYIYEQPAAELFNSLLPKYVAVQIFRALLESVAAEHAARMTAMDAATNNASEMIDSLTLAMNRARQAKITKEIIEIVSGAAAL